MKQWFFFFLAHIRASQAQNIQAACQKLQTLAKPWAWNQWQPIDYLKSCKSAVEYLFYPLFGRIYIHDDTELLNIWSPDPSLLGDLSQNGEVHSEMTQSTAYLCLLPPWIVLRRAIGRCEEAHPVPTKPPYKQSPLPCLGSRGMHTGRVSASQESSTEADSESKVGYVWGLCV